MRRDLAVARFTRAWIETSKWPRPGGCSRVARFTRAWIETNNDSAKLPVRLASPASRGRGLKRLCAGRSEQPRGVARFTRAWIETSSVVNSVRTWEVARFTRAWIETH